MITSAKCGSDNPQIPRHTTGITSTGVGSEQLIKSAICLGCISQTPGPTSVPKLPCVHPTGISPSPCRPWKPKFPFSPRAIRLELTNPPPTPHHPPWRTGPPPWLRWLRGPAGLRGLKLYVGMAASLEPLGVRSLLSADGLGGVWVLG